jgi:hypothetical protein
LDFLLHQNVNLSIVQEWQPLALSSQRGILFMLVVGCCFFLAIVRKSELRFDELLLLALGAWMAGSHDRMLFVFGILAAPILSRMCSTSWEGYNAAADRIWPNALMIAMALLVAFLAFPSAKNLATQADKNSPVQAVEFIKANHLSGPMMNDYAYGGYLIWALHASHSKSNSREYRDQGLRAEARSPSQPQSQHRTGRCSACSAPTAPARPAPSA